MDARKVALALAGVPLLGGCMMGGMAYTGGAGEPGHRKIGEVSGPPHHAEGSRGDLTIELSFPTPTVGAAVPIDARLADPDERIDAAIRLRAQTPAGSVDRIPMRRLESSPGSARRATYRFRTPRSYLMTAGGRTETNAGVRVVTVTTRAEVERESPPGRHGWRMPVAVVGGLGMVVMMAVMMGT